MRARSWIVALTVCSTTVLGWPVAVADDGAPTARPVAKIAYVAHSDSGSDLFVVLPDGSRRSRFTFSGGVADPAWSRDGKRLAFAVHGDIWVASNQWNERRITTGGGYGSPSWSADGTRIVADHAVDLGSELVVIDVATSTQQVIVPASERWPGAWQPSWSPDGSTIAFIRLDSEGDDYAYYRRLFVVGPDGSGLSEVTPAEVGAGDPQWSPDGTRLLYTHSYHGRGGECSNEVTVMGADGTGLHTVLKQGCEDRAGSWSPRGGRMAFSTDSVDWWDAAAPQLAGVWTADLDGGHRQLVAAGGWDPAWQPRALRSFERGSTAGHSTTGGRRLAIAATSARGWDVFTLRPDGTGLRRLTDLGDATGPSWSPDRRWIAFIRKGSELWVMRSDGSGRRKVTGWMDGHAGLSWSPDGRRVVYSDGYLMTIDVRTRHKHQVPGLRRFDGYTYESVSRCTGGPWIAFTSGGSGGREDLYVVRPDGTRLTRLTRSRGLESQVQWSDRCDRLAVTTTSDLRQTDLLVVRRATGVRQVLWDWPGSDYSAAWNGTGRLVAFVSEGPRPHGTDPQPGLWVSSPQGRFARLVLERRTISSVDW